MKNRTPESLKRLKEKYPQLDLSPIVYHDGYWDGLHDILSKYPNKKKKN